MMGLRHQRVENSIRHGVAKFFHVVKKITEIVTAESLDIAWSRGQIAILPVDKLLSRQGIDDLTVTVQLNAKPQRNQHIIRDAMLYPTAVSLAAPVMITEVIFSRRYRQSTSG
jgi:hypothetical protein